VATAAISVTTRARLLRLALATIALLAAIAVAIHPGSAGTAATGSCPGSGDSVFLPWLDPARYVLAPGGDFETAGGWKLSGGAKVVSGNEPWRVHGTKDRRSLSIPAGASATTPALCAGLGDPTLRLFAAGGSLTSGLKVEAIYRTALGTVTQPVAALPGTGNWAPTPPLPFLANATGLLSLDGLTSSVQFRFTVTGRSGWTIDDVYVDPWKIG
jgi:hypothetical protein